MEFEKLVSKELERNGISIRKPSNGHIKLLNIKDNEKNPTLEIDIIAHYNNTIFVIDCKHVVISTDFITGNRVNNLKRNLKDEREKMNNRVRFVSKNMKKYGFRGDVFKEIKPVFITYNEEPEKEFEGITIISLQRLAELKGKKFGDYVLSNTRGTKIFSNLEVYKVLEIPNVERRKDGKRYHVLSVGKINVGGKESLVATIRLRGENKLMLLPDGYSKWVNFCMVASSLGGNMFPADVIFWHSYGDGQYYAYIL